MTHRFFRASKHAKQDSEAKIEKKTSRPVTEVTRILGAPLFLAWMFLSLFFFPLLMFNFPTFFSWFDISKCCPLLTFWLVDVSVCRLKELQASDQVWFPVSVLCIMTGKTAKHNPFHEKQVHFG